MSAAPFRWHDGERLVVFGRGMIAGAAEILGGRFVLLSTARAAASAPELVSVADAVHEIGAGRVDDLAGSLRGVVRGELVVALGGGRVIDTAKALAAAQPPLQVAAIPTTLSGAEMTDVHMHAAGVAAETPHVRPAIVINDPALSASQPPRELARSAANALAHVVEGPATTRRGPVTSLAALEAARLLARCFAPGALSVAPGAADAARQDELGLAALLAGYVIGSTRYGLHHVMAQTVRRVGRLGHGEANAILLPHTLAALERREPKWIARLAEALGAPTVDLARRLAAAAGVSTLAAAGLPREAIDECVERAAGRAELALTPPVAGRDELRELYLAAL